MLNYQRINIHFPMVFPWFSHGFRYGTSPFPMEKDRTSLATDWSQRSNSENYRKTRKPQENHRKTTGKLEENEDLPSDYLT